MLMIVILFLILLGMYVEAWMIFRYSIFTSPLVVQYPFLLTKEALIIKEIEIKVNDSYSFFGAT